MSLVAFVDDHSLFRETVSEKIETITNYKVVQYKDGSDFVNRFLTENIQPAIVLMDISMPGLNGYQTTEWLLQKRPNTPVLVVSFISNREAIQFMARLGVKGAISKNAGVFKMIDAMNQIIDGKIYFDCDSSYKILHSEMYVNGKKVKEGIESLTKMEMRVLKELCTNKSVPEIADELEISERTFDAHKRNISDKIGIRTRDGLAVFAIKNGLVFV